MMESQLQTNYERLARHHTTRGLVRELGPGIALRIAIVLACVLLPVLPGEIQPSDVGSAPPASSSFALLPQTSSRSLRLPRSDFPGPMLNRDSQNPWTSEHSRG